MTAAAVLVRAAGEPAATEPGPARPVLVEVAPLVEVAGAAEVAGPVAPAPSPPYLESLVLAAVRGDLRARERLLGEIHPFVLRYCRGRLGRQETVTASADDVAQEVCLAVINALPAYTVKGLSFRAFVYGIAAHKVTDAYRAIGRSRTDPVAELPDSPVHDDGPEHRLLAAEMGGRLSRLLEALTPRQRDVLVLRIMVGLSAEETAAVVGSTPGAVRVTQHRALNRLRAILDVDGAHHRPGAGDVMPAVPAPRGGAAR
jgi:RNA polymerase sigma-70 factor, ECF subfamily